MELNIQAYYIFKYQSQKLIIFTRFYIKFKPSKATLAKKTTEIVVPNILKDLKIQTDTKVQKRLTHSYLQPQTKISQNQNLNSIIHGL